MADQDPIAQMPTQISPQALATLFPGAQTPTAPTIAPQAPAGGGGPLDDPNLRALVAQQSQAGMGAFGEREKAAMDINRQLSGGPGAPGLIQQQAEAAKGLSFHPSFSGGFLHNLGQALLTIGAATRPGQAVENVIYAQPREEYAGRAQRIQELQSEQRALSEGLTPAAQLAYKPFQAEAAERKAGAAETTAQARVQDVISRHQDALARIAAMTDIAAKRNATQVEITGMRDEMMKQITGMKDITQEDVARIMASSAQSLLNTKIAEDPSIAGAIKRAFGLGGAEAPGGAQPVAGQAPLPPRTAQSTKPTAKAGNVVPKGTTVYDPQGQAHSSDGTHPLPKGWSLKKPGA